MRRDGNIENQFRVHRIEQYSMVVMNEFVAVFLNMDAIGVVALDGECRRTVFEPFLYD